MGLHVTVVPLKGVPELLEKFLERGVEVDLSLLNKNFAVQITLLRRKSYKSDLWHAHLPQAELLLASTKNVPVVISRHFGGQFYPKAPRLISLALSRLATRRAVQIVAISNFVLEYLKSSGEISTNKPVNVVHYGFDTVEFRRRIAAQNTNPPVTKRTVKFGTLSRLSWEKDLETMILGFEIYNNESIGESQLEIFGDGIERDALAGLVKSLNLSERVRFMGRTENVPEALSQLDFFILSSRFEGFGMVLLEAMAAGLPIVCSRIPAALEVLGENGAAVFFSPGDPRELALALEKVQGTNQESREREQQIRLDQFGSKKMSREIMEIYFGINRPQI